MTPEQIEIERQKFERLRRSKGEPFFLGRNGHGNYDDYPTACSWGGWLACASQRTTWLPIETAPKDNKRPLYLAQFSELGQLLSIDVNGVYLKNCNCFTGNSLGDQAPTHFAYQDEPIPTVGDSFFEWLVKRRGDSFSCRTLVDEILERFNAAPQPPKREWVGLTDDELHQLARICQNNDGTVTYELFARKFEAYLKEKNQ